MTRAGLVDVVSRTCNLSRGEAQVVVSAVFASLVVALRRGEKIEVRGFGSFRIRHRQSHRSLNPRTGASLVVPAKFVPRFKPAKGFLALLNGR